MTPLSALLAAIAKALQMPSPNLGVALAIA